MSDRFVFFGTGANFTMTVLKNLQGSGALPLLIVVPEYRASRTRPESELPVLKPESPNPLIMFAERHDIRVIYAPQSKVTELTEHLSAVDFEFIVVACWPYLIPDEVCNTANKAAMNIHPSILPAYRGVDPIRDQIENSEEEPGVSLHLLNNEFDAGDIVATATFEGPAILEREYLENRAAKLGAKLFIEACRNFGGPDWHPIPQ